MSSAKLLLVSLTLTLSSCRSITPVLSPTAPACDNACTALSAYGCEEAQPRKIGPRTRTCVERCKQIENTGYMSVAPECVVQHASSLEDIRRVCNYECKQGKQ